MSDAMESRARRAAKRAGYVASKSRWRLGTIDNNGGFQILDPYTNTVIDGVQYELSAQAVIERCNGDWYRKAKSAVRL